MTKKEFKRKMCPNCICYGKCKEEDIEELEEGNVYKMWCKNYHKFEECIRKSCRECGKCNEI